MSARADHELPEVAEREHHGPDDLIVYGLAGFCLLSVVAQLRLAPIYHRLRFGPTFWTFTFSYSAVATFALQLIGREHPDHARLLGWLVLGAITTFVGVVFAQTVRAIGAHRFFPAVAPERPS